MDATTENEGTGAWNVAKGCVLDDCEGVIWLDMITNR